MANKQEFVDYFGFIFQICTQVVVAIHTKYERALTYHLIMS